MQGLGGRQATSIPYGFVTSVPVLFLHPSVSPGLVTTAWGAEVCPVVTRATKTVKKEPSCYSALPEPCLHHKDAEGSSLCHLLGSPASFS
ncbi:hypothetical protein Y1Q_0006087 [Alligator mississippiensis]|uniref:Uncharacterized protein n=1 Tax=Alligator mississippiensis TaxID=8496 RepID=A0A151N3W4_ALLMI|nr:hypothetical protein Y1Q_0006087 [Alligator mississippiensis]